MLLSIAYFPPIEYFSVLAKCSFSSTPVRMEACEHYCKQSYRNRCRILTAGGVEDLNVPVVHDGDIFKTPVTQIKVDYSTPWVERTLRAIESAYSSSPFFEYYRDGVFALLENRPETLWELDMDIIRYFCDKTGICPEIVPTCSFAPCGDPQEDLRCLIHPKKAPVSPGCEYWQVFKEKFGFVPNLSIMDLLFNEGTESLCYLTSSQSSVPCVQSTTLTVTNSPAL